MQGCVRGEGERRDEGVGCVRGEGGRMEEKEGGGVGRGERLVGILVSDNMKKCHALDIAALTEEG